MHEKDAIGTEQNVTW